ncbi:hypothetical protein OIU76_008094 [Salix suchowensis]|nr:hypothetical protein OIU76_008094 [Salix suchowensis]
MAKPTASGPIKSTTTTNAPSSPPPYFKMITEAITALKDRTGSSQPAIARFIEEKYKKSSLPSNFKKVLSVQLKRDPGKKRVLPRPHPEKKAAEKKISSKGVQTRRLSQVKTPEVFKKEVKAAKMKRLSQVKTPDGFKKEKKSTPMQKKNLKAGSSSSSRAHNK